MRLPYGPFNYYDLTQFRPGLSRFYANNNSPSKKLGIQSCISYRITDDIHVRFRNHIINNWVNEQFAVLLCWNVYTHMHGLIFETSIWLLAGSTRFPSRGTQRSQSTFASCGTCSGVTPISSSGYSKLSVQAFCMLTSIRIHTSNSRFNCSVILKFTVSTFNHSNFSDHVHTIYPGFNNVHCYIRFQFGFIFRIDDRFTDSK